MLPLHFKKHQHPGLVVSVLAVRFNRDAAKNTSGTMQRELSTHITWGQFRLRQQLVFDNCRNYRLVCSFFHDLQMGKVPTR